MQGHRIMFVSKGKTAYSVNSLKAFNKSNKKCHEI